MADIKELLKQIKENKEKVKKHFHQNKQCKATTKSGKPCKNEAVENGYCSVHQKGE